MRADRPFRFQSSLRRRLGLGGLAWLALLAMAVRMPFAAGYMAEAGGYAAICPSGLSDAQSALLLPQASHAAHGGHHDGMAGMDAGKSTQHQHDNRSCDAALHAVAAFLPLHLVMSASMPPSMASTLRQATPALPAHWSYQARGPPRSVGHPRPT